MFGKLSKEDLLLKAKAASKELTSSKEVDPTKHISSLDDVVKSIFMDKASDKLTIEDWESIYYLMKYLVNSN